MARAALVAILLALLVAAAGSAAPRKGDGPISIAAGYGSVWVGTGNGTLVRIDAATGKVRGRFLREALIQYGFVRALAVGFGSVWAADRWEVARIDPQSHRVREIESVAWAPGTVATGRGAVWVADFDRNMVFRIDPRRARVVARIHPSSGRLLGLAAGPAGVWVVLVPGSGPIGSEGPRHVTQVDTQRNRIGSTVLRTDCDVALAVGPRSLWVSDLCAKTLTRIGDRPASLPVAGASISVAAGEGAVWVLSQEERTVTRVDPRTLRIVATIPVRGTWLSPGAGAVWVLDQGDGRVGFVRRIDPRTNRVVGRPIRIDPR